MTSLINGLFWPNVNVIYRKYPSYRHFFDKDGVPEPQSRKEDTNPGLGLGFVPIESITHLYDPPAPRESVKTRICKVTTFIRSEINQLSKNSLVDFVRRKNRHVKIFITLKSGNRKLSSQPWLRFGPNGRFLNESPFLFFRWFLNFTPETDTVTVETFRILPFPRRPGWAMS